MATTIDTAGRVVIPKAIREAAELKPGAEIEIGIEDGRVVIAPAFLRTRLEEQDGVFVLVPEHPVPTMPEGMVESVLERLRTRR